MMSADPGLVHGRYRLGPVVGEGAMATVSRATDEVLQRDVAIKMLKPIFATDPDVVERFYVEARAVAALAHPHIVALYDVLDDAPGDAIVMEFVGGGSLAAKLAAGGALPEADAIGYARDVAAALEAAHQRGILHRDIKPANMLLALDGGVKVADFGLAKALAETDLGLTHPGRLVGSAHYFSPEQAQGLPLTPASDLYSLGVSIYQLVTGALPFDASSAVSVAVAHVTAPAPTESAMSERMSPALAGIVARLLQKDPLLRFQSARDLAAALDAIATRPDTGWQEPTMLGQSPSPFVAPPARAAASPRTSRARVDAERVLAAFFAWSRSASERVQPYETRLRNVEPRWFALGAFLLVLLVAAAYSALRPAPLVAVGDVRRLQLATAQARLHDAGLQSSVHRVDDAHVAAGTVIAQQPAPGRQLARDASIALTVSNGPHLFRVPDFRGASFAAARRMAKSAALDAKFAAKIDATPFDHVIDQFPVAGTRVRAHTAALIIISAGPHPHVTFGSSSNGDDGG